jgi:branched-chain amino acid transport system ATP-binding protein
MLSQEDNVLLKVENLEVHYGDLQALYGVSLRISKGSIVSIIGSNGAGKSTLLATITGINKPTKGRITFKDEDISGIRTHKIVSKGITMSPEGSRVFEKMSVEENLLMGAYLPRARRKKEELLKRVYGLFPALKEKSGQLATYLSGGQRQMLAIGRALMVDPEVILCDEVSMGLAPVIVKDIYHKIREINQEGMTFILVEQDVKRSLKYSDYSYVMVKGKIVMEGPSSQLPEEEVKDAFFGIHKYA